MVVHHLNLENCHFAEQRPLYSVFLQGNLPDPGLAPEHIAMLSNVLALFLPSFTFSKFTYLPDNTVIYFACYS